MELTIKEYMEKYGVKSKQTVYNRIEKGSIQSYTKDGKRYIIIEEKLDNENEENSPNYNLILKKELEYAKKELDTLKGDKEDLRKRLDEAEKKADQSNHLLMVAQGNLKNLTQAVQKLEYEKQEKEKELKEEKSKKWWQKLFKK